MDLVTGFYIFRQLRILIGIISFIGLFTLDLWKAWKRKAHWIPQGALFLSAFTLQLLDLLDYEIVSIGDPHALKKWSVEILKRDELLVAGGRVMVCVYMGYLLPEMARSPCKRTVWSDIGALAISLLAHISSELCVFIELYSSVKPLNPLSIVTRVCTMICAMFLFLCLGSAVFAGRTLYHLVLQKIPIALGEERYSQETVENDVFQCWFVAWVCKPDYLISRSVLVSSVGVSVTLCVGCFGAEWITQNYQDLHYTDEIDWFRYTVIAFMCLLILIGWSAICWRWMAACIYFPGKYKIPGKGYFHVEDFWKRHIFEVKDEIEFRHISWDQHVSGGGILDNLKLQLFRAIGMHRWLHPLLLALQIVVILFSKLCCFLTEKILFVKKIRSLMLGKEGQNDPEFLEFEERLVKVQMTGEDRANLWIANGKSIKQIKDFMEKGRKDGRGSNELVELMKKGSNNQNCVGRMCLEPANGSRRLPVENAFDYLKKLSWKMTTLSLIKVIMELEDHSAADNAVKAYSQAYEFLDLLDSSIASHFLYQPELYVRAADKQLIIMKQQFHRTSRPTEKYAIGAALEKVRNLQEEAEGRINSYNLQDSVDWSAVAADNSLYKICKIIRDKYEDSETTDGQLVDKVERLLADVMVIMLKEKVGEELVRSCREWAASLEEKKIRASVYIAGKAKGLAEKLGENNSSTAA